MDDLGKTSSGLQPNVVGLLAYLMGFVTGLIFLLTEKDNRFVRFHAIQSICLSGAALVAEVVVGFLPVIGWIASLLVNGVWIALWIVCMIKAYQGEWFRLPVAGDIAAQQVGGL